MDILILYMSLMLFIPVALMLLSKERRILYWLLLVTAWLIARLHIDVAISEIFAEKVFDTTEYFRLRGSFNPFSYALIFYSGFYLGYRYKLGGEANFVRSVVPLHGWLFAVAALVMSAFVIAECFRTFLGTPIWIYDPKRYEITITGCIGLAAIAYVVYFLLAEKNLKPPLLWLSKMVGRIFTFRILVLIGQNSLFFYSLHVLGVFVSSYVIKKLDMTESEPFIISMFFVATSLMIVLTAAKKRFLPSLP